MYFIINNVFSAVRFYKHLAKHNFSYLNINYGRYLDVNNQNKIHFKNNYNSVAPNGQLEINPIVAGLFYWCINASQGRIEFIYMLINPTLQKYIYSYLTLIPVWISNYIHRKMRDETTYRFHNFNDAAVGSLRMDE